MRHVAMLYFILITITFSGCSQKECKSIFIPQKCIVPYTPEPIIDYTQCSNEDYACITSKVLKNYEAQKNYARELKINSEVCK